MVLRYTKYTHKLLEYFVFTCQTLHGVMHWSCGALWLSFERIIVTIAWHFEHLKMRGHALPRGDTAHCIIPILNKRRWRLLSIRKVMEKYLSPKDTTPDVLRLMGAIIGGQGSGVGLIKLGCNPAPSTY